VVMKKPCHPGEIVGDAIKELGLSLSAAAEQLNVARKTLSQLVNGRSGVSPEMALRLEKALGSSADAWVRMQAAYDLAQARMRGVDPEVKRLAPGPLS